MFRRFTEPLRENFATDAEYFEELAAWDNEQSTRARYIEDKSTR